MNKKINIILISLIVLTLFINWFFIHYLVKSNFINLKISKILDNIMVLPIGLFFIWKFNLVTLKIDLGKQIFFSFILLSILESIFFYKSINPLYNIIGYLIGAILTYFLVILFKLKNERNNNNTLATKNHQL